LNLSGKSGVEVRKLYNLRHTFASQMISKGAHIVWVSKMLGHKDVSITLKIYTKFIQEDDEMRFKKIEKMGTILGTIEEFSVENSDK
jgi:integrase